MDNINSTHSEIQENLLKTPTATQVSSNMVNIVNTSPINKNNTVAAATAAVAAAVAVASTSSTNDDSHHGVHSTLQDNVDSDESCDDQENIQPRTKRIHRQHDDTMPNIDTIKYDTGGSSCHQCKSRRATSGQTFCRNVILKKNKSLRSVCRKKYCDHCLRKFYNVSPPSISEEKYWKCPACRKECSCAACRKKMLKNSLKIAQQLSGTNTSLPNASSLHEYNRIKNSTTATNAILNNTSKSVNNLLSSSPTMKQRNNKNASTAAAVVAVSNMNTIPITLRTLSSTAASSALYARNISSQQQLMKQNMVDGTNAQPIVIGKGNTDIYDSIIPGINDNIPNFFSGRAGTNLQATFHDSMQQCINQQDIHHDILHIGLDTSSSGSLRNSNFMNNAAGTYNTADTIPSTATQEIIPSQDISGSTYNSTTANTSTPITVSNEPIVSSTGNTITTSVTTMVNPLVNITNSSNSGEGNIQINGNNSSDGTTGGVSRNGVYFPPEELEQLSNPTKEEVMNATAQGSVYDQQHHLQSSQGDMDTTLHNRDPVLNMMYGHHQTGGNPLQYTQDKEQSNDTVVEGNDMLQTPNEQLPIGMNTSPQQQSNFQQLSKTFDTVSDVYSLGSSAPSGDGSIADTNEKNKNNKSQYQEPSACGDNEIYDCIKENNPSNNDDALLKTCWQSTASDKISPPVADSQQDEIPDSITNYQKTQQSQEQEQNIDNDNVKTLESEETGKKIHKDDLQDYTVGTESGMGTFGVC